MIRDKWGTFYHRPNVPRDLVEYIGTRQIWVTLRTKDPQVAKERERIAAIHTEQWFNQCRQELAAKRPAPPKPTTPEWRKITPDLITSVRGEIIHRLMALDEDARLHAPETMGRFREVMENDKEYYKKNVYNVSDPDIQKVIAGVLKGLNIEVDQQDPQYLRLSASIIDALYRAADGIAKRNQGDYIETPSPIMEQKSISILQAHEHWANRTDNEKMKGEYRKAVDLFIQLHGNISVNNITREHMRRYRDTIENIPIFTGTRYNGTFSELAEIVKENPALKLTSNTMKKYMMAINVAVNLAVKEGYMDNFSNWNNPCTEMLDVNGKESNVVYPFTNEELTIIFGKDYPGEGDNYWIPLIALYTGMRMSEILQLTKEDIKCEGEIYYFDINKNDGKSVKTKQSIRKIPVHQDLMKLGLIDYISEKVKIFNATKVQYSSVFSRYLSKIGIIDKSKVFHSFRHTFTAACEAVGMDIAVQYALEGHSLGTVGQKHYSKGYPLNVLNNALQSIHYDVLIPKS